MAELLLYEEIKGISHLGVVVPDIEMAYKQYSLLGFKEKSEGIIREEEHGILAKVIEQDGVIIELMSPISNPEDSPYAEQLRQNRYSLDHICYRVSSIDEAIEVLKKNRFIPISKPHMSGVWNKKVVLLANRRMGVIELLEDVE